MAISTRCTTQRQSVTRPTVPTATFTPRPVPAGDPCPTTRARSATVCNGCLSTGATRRNVHVRCANCRPLLHSLAYLAERGRVVAVDHHSGEIPVARPLADPEPPEERVLRLQCMCGDIEVSVSTYSGPISRGTLQGGYPAVGASTQYTRIRLEGTPLGMGRILGRNLQGVYKCKPFPNGLRSASPNGSSEVTRGSRLTSTSGCPPTTHPYKGRRQRLPVISQRSMRSCSKMMGLFYFAWCCVPCILTSISKHGLRHLPPLIL